MAARKSKSLAIVHQAGAQLYRQFLEGIKERIRTAQLKAALAANAELVLHYWEPDTLVLAEAQFCRGFSVKRKAG
jgi:hypothetical protein